MPITNFEDLVKILALFDGSDGPAPESVWWRTDGEYAPFTLFVNCNDFFAWGCADCEEITAEDYNDLVKAIKDASNSEHGWAGHLLWVARKRKMRPQGAYYKYLDEAVHHLFDEAGPARSVDMLNPVDQAASSSSNA